MRKKVELYLSLGSNMGDKEGNINLAISLLNKLFAKPYSKLSTIIKNPAWGFEGEEFLNCVLSYQWEFDTENFEQEALNLLDACKEIELQMGRKSRVEYDAQGQRIYHSRIIDIDILLIGNEKLQHQRLTIPHPQIDKRPFVLEPLKEILSS